jgi:hypothetical protein
MTTKHNDIRFTHIRDVVDSALGPLSKGGATVAWKYDDANQRIVYSVALCSRKDNFCRRTGRAVSAGRLTKSSASVPYSVLTTRENGPSFKEVANYFFETVIII